jgi:lantibiotic transport system ATP-binding protein
MLFQNTVKLLKESQSEKLILEIETNNINLLKDIATSLSLNPEIIDSDSISISVDSKKEIPQLIDELRKKQVNIYQIKIKDNLEELFLSLTEN